MSKILDNTTGAPITINDTGVTVDNVTNYTIPANDFALWAESVDVITEINAGNIVVKNGSISLSAAEGIKYLAHPDQGLIRISSNDKTAKHLLDKLAAGIGMTFTEVSDGDDEKISISSQSAIGAIIPYVFVTTGNTSDKWLGSYVPSTTSDVVPLVLMQNAQVRGILFSNQDDNVDIDVQIFKNGTLAHTEQIRNKRTYFNAGFLGPNFLQGDRMSIFLKKFTDGTGDNTAQNPIVWVLAKVTYEAGGSGGTQYGV